jgi:branched-chain amino acid transport system permease protein
MPSITQLLQSLSDGLATGASYAVLALAFTVLWATVRTVNMAILQLVTVGGVVAYYAAGAGAVVAFLAGIGAATGLGLITHYSAVRPTLKNGQIYPIIATLGVGLLITGGISLIFGEDLQTVPPLLPT